METLKAILERRSVRKYTGQALDRQKLLTLVKAGMAAPTSRDTRHFHFLIVDDPDVVQKLADRLPYAKMLLTSKYAIVVASDISVAHGGTEMDYWVQDSCAAAENILLAAKDMDLGTCWTAAHPRPERIAVVKETLGLPEHIMPLCVIAVGIPAGEEKPRDKFDPSHVSWNRWGNNSSDH